MAESKQASVSGNYYPTRYIVTFPRDPMKREFELSITLRAPSPYSRIPHAEQPTPDELAKIEARTILNWN